MGRVGMVGSVRPRRRPGRGFVLALLFAVCALFLGVCHGHLNVTPAGAPVSAVGQHECPGSGHGAHAEADGQVAAQPVDRAVPDGVGAGRVEVSSAPPGGGRSLATRTRAGPHVAGHSLLIAIGIDRN
ncbi:hypothetical protein KY5_3865c [Streptomyces formicae]|uniref:Uncharacterized protein n=1 Tax=Streptomyces formicae TaxID=1616117 RepID=A0A291QBN9_9ACTN|nr:hypothetical protein KY5_3865c [Streptomyces formicae]